MKFLNLHILIIQQIVFIRLCLCITTKPLNLNTTNNSNNKDNNDDNKINLVNKNINNQNNIGNYNNNNSNENLLSTYQQIVDDLVRKWSPLVWLAPGEKFMPSSTTVFLKNVHAERGKKSTNNIHDISEITDLNKYSYYYYYNDENELTYYDPIVNNRNKRNYRDKNVIFSALDMTMGEKSEEWFLVTNDNVDELINNEKSFLYGENPNSDNVPIYAVVNICSTGTLVSSYSPTQKSPLLPADNMENDVVYNTIEKVEYKKNPYIPLTKDLHLLQSETHTSAQSFSLSSLPPTPSAPSLISISPSSPLVYNPLIPISSMSSLPIISLSPNLYQNSDTSSMDTIDKVQKSMNTRWRKKREIIQENINKKDENEEFEKEDNTIRHSNEIDNIMQDEIEEFRHTNDDKDKDTNTVEAEWNRIIVNKDDYSGIISINLQDSIHKDDDMKLQLKKKENCIPHFHVTYWMFYPYNRGKTICTLNLGPLGPLPIPLIFGMCLGSKKEYGSHVGDWEHMSLFFRGKNEPEEMYVSAHDAGAYYTYDRLTGTFEYSSQETRKGILQRPSFPRTVITSSNHPVLFAAEGSHGLWTAPGKHRFVRVPRLYDVNGFGTPWSTWKNIQIIYDNHLRVQGPLNPDWMRFRGRWGNPKSKCHPLKKIGLHFCEYSDGPTGIPRKQHNFYCKSK